MVCHRLPTSVNLGQCQQCQAEVGHGRKCGGSRWNCVCMLLETEVTLTIRKSSIFPWRVPLVFQVAPGKEKSYVHAKNAKTSKI
jgi:hypothetical protein